MMYYGLNRYMCDVIEEMRKIIKINESVMLKQPTRLLNSLIEEVQVLGTRMEASLSDVNDFETLHEDISRDKKILQKLRKEIKKLEEEQEGLMKSVETLTEKVKAFK